MRTTIHERNIRVSHVSDYLESIQAAGNQLSEVHMCTCFARHILGGLLAYDENDWVINPNAGKEGGEGIPDITIYAGKGEMRYPWIECEAKLADSEIRDSARRQRLWTDKKKYIKPDTVYFLWIAERTIIVCNPVGEPLVTVYLDLQHSGDSKQEFLHSTDDAEVREALALISAHQARSESFLEEFRNGELPYAYIEVDLESVEQLTGTLRNVLASLRGYLKRRWNIMWDEYRAYEEKRDAFEATADRARDAMPQDIRESRRQRIEHEYRHARELFEFAFPQFCQQQAYTEWEKEESSQADEEALADIFRTDAAYVILGRILFVRFAEDQQDDNGQPLIRRKISNGGLKFWRKLVGADESHIGRLLDLAFTQAGSIFQQIFSETPFDTLIDLKDTDFDRVLLLVLYKLNAFDFARVDRDLLGDLYQELLPRDMRKKLGEFYTDDEVVDYILHHTGFVEAAEQGAPTLIDPACGSGTFLVRAAYYLIEGARSRGVTDSEILDLVSRCIHGLDINDFAVFIARVNLLFTCFDLMINAKKDIAFPIHEANSLVRPGQYALFATGGDSEIELGRTDSENVRDAQYDFVVGNPPYVRPERLPDSDRTAIQNTYSAIAARNTDLAAYFVYRGREWLDENGTFGMIVPRGITDAAYSRPLRNLLEQNVTLTELTPLDWAAHDLFDSDIVPVILQYVHTERQDRPEISLVQGLRSKDEIQRAAKDPASHTSVLPWADFRAAADHVWPMEATPEDLTAYQWLQEHTPRNNEHIRTRLGIKLGAECAAVETPRAGYAPLITGSDIYSYALGSPRRYAPIQNAEDPSLWANATWNGTSGCFHFNDPPLPQMETIVACANIGITLNASLIDHHRYAAQDTVVFAWWAETHRPIGALASLLNSTLSRWFSFVFLRGGVVGGGRRDHHIYPRTVAALPTPPAGQTRWQDSLASLSDQIHHAAHQAALLDDEIWGRVIEDYEPRSTLSAWPIDWNDWPDHYGLSRQSMEIVRETKNLLNLSRGVALRSDNTAVLDFLRHHVPIVVQQRERIEKEGAQGLEVPNVTAVPQILDEYQKQCAKRDDSREQYTSLLTRIDGAVFRAFDMPHDIRNIIEKRMSEFPLNDYAANYRRPWEPTTPPDIKIFEPGERYH